MRYPRQPVIFARTVSFVGSPRVIVAGAYPINSIFFWDINICAAKQAGFTGQPIRIHAVRHRVGPPPISPVPWDTTLP